MDWDSCTKDWNDLPNEMKISVIQHLDKNSRLALRACSSNEKQLVDCSPFRVMQDVCLEKDNDRWKLSVLTKMQHYPYTEQLVSQEKLEPFMKKADHIYHFFFEPKGSDYEFRHSHSAKQINVARFVCNEKTPPIDFIRQINSHSLKFLKIHSDENIQGIYDMPQILHVEKIEMTKCMIDDDQLLRLNAQNLYFGFSPNLTSGGVNKFLKKIVKVRNFRRFHTHIDKNVYDLDKILEGLHVISIKGEYDYKYITIGTEFPYFELKLEIRFEENRSIEAYMMFNTSLSEYAKIYRSNKFRVIETLHVDSNRGESGFLTVCERNENYFGSHFENYDQLQSMMRELLEGVTYIKYLQILNFNSRFELFSPNKQVSVGSIDLKWDLEDFIKQSDSYVIALDFVKQLKEGDLKCIRFDTDAYLRRWDIFDLPQFRLAETINTPKCCIRNLQLPKLKAVSLNVRGLYLTSYGINHYIKQCIRDLNQNSRAFEVHYRSSHNRIGKHSRMLKGLKVISYVCEQDYWYKDYIFVLDTTHPDYLFEVRHREETIRGSPILRV